LHYCYRNGTGHISAFTTSTPIQQLVVLITSFTTPAIAGIIGPTYVSYTIVLTVSNAFLLYVMSYAITQHSVDLLVLDRTFSSLSAAAQRLIGGWTKVSLGAKIQTVC
jgi:hypothetical protein